MIRSLIYSITFHSVLVLLTVLSLPFMLREPIDLPPLVSVEFIEIKELGQSLGLGHVESGPLVRSSYHADEQHTKLSEPISIKS